ncbi:hypothetical protein D9M71_590250 [compost metagenome]
MPEQAVQHAGQAAEQARPAGVVLGQVGHQAEQQGQAQQQPRALAQFDAFAQFPVPQAVHGQVQHAEVQQHGRYQAPPLAFVQALRQRAEVQVVALDAEVEEGEPADGGEVVAQAGEAGDDEAQQQG